MQNTGKIKAVLFDLDGVLIDATEWHFNALNRALALFGYSISRYAHLSDYNGLPTRTKLQMLSVEKGLPTSLHALIGKIKQVYTHEEIITHCAPVFEKEYMLSRLSREGYRMAVCSNSIRTSIELMLHRSGIDQFFDFILSNEDVGKSKPAPDIYVKAISRMNLDPSQVMIVEDAPHGVEAARKSGANVCHVQGFAEVDYLRIKSALRDIESSASQQCSR